MSAPAETIANEWLAQASATVAEGDLVGHLDLLSRDVSLTGIPGFEVIGYDDWAAQCEHDFVNNLIRSVNYQNMEVVAATDLRVMFRAREIVEGSDGVVDTQDIEVSLHKEEDGKWRLIQERVLSEDEAPHGNRSS
ncbi:MAG: hypothetical protein ACWA5Q_00640 [bacterium]